MLQYHRFIESAREKGGCREGRVRDGGVGWDIFYFKIFPEDGVPVPLGQARERRKKKRGGAESEGSYCAVAGRRLARLFRSKQAGMEQKSFPKNRFY